MLRASARDFLSRECPSPTVRALIETPDAHDPALWATLAGLGWTGLGIPEAYGGAGGFGDLAVVEEEIGRALLPGPFLSTMGLLVPALLEAGSESQRRDVLSRVAAGEAIGTVALAEPSGRWDAGGIQLGAVRVDGGWRLDGRKDLVPDAGVATHIVVPARTGARDGGITLFLVEGRPDGLTLTAHDGLDLTRRWYQAAFDGVRLDDGAVLGRVGDGWEPMRRALEWGTTALCAEMIGGGQRVLDLSVEYVKTRQQFGRPIGAYQAVSHRVADMLQQTESARSATYYATWAIDADAPDRSLAVSAAKAYTSDAYLAAAGSAIQVHGGIGFTWEHDLHLYYRRAKASEQLLGDATYHRELVAQALDL